MRTSSFLIPLALITLAASARAQSRDIYGFGGSFDEAVIPFNGYVLYDADGNTATEGDQVRLYGCMGFFLGGHSLCDGCNGAAYTLTGSPARNAAFEIQADVDANFSERLPKILTVPGPSYTIWIPFPLPGWILTITTDFAAYLEFSGSIQAGTTLGLVTQAETPYTAEQSVGAGATFSGTPGGEPPYTGTSPPILTGNGAASFELGSGIEMHLQMSGSAIPIVDLYLTLGSYQQLSVDTLADPWWELESRFLAAGGSSTLFTSLNSVFLDSGYFTILDAGGPHLGAGSGSGSRWSKAYDVGYAAFSGGAAPSPNGGYLIAGRDGSSLGLLIEVDDLGVPIWAKEYSLGYLIRSVRATGRGTWLVAGAIQQTGPCWMAEVDAVGDPIWSKAYVSTTGPSDLQYAEPTADGGAVATGAVQVGSDTFHLVLRVDTNGDLLWSRRYAMATPGHPSGTEAHETANNGFIVVGTLGSAPVNGLTGSYLLSLDANGDVLWSSALEPATYGNSVLERPEGGFLAAAHYLRTVFDTQHAAFLYAVDASGNLEWANGYAGKSHGAFSTGDSLWDSALSLSVADQAYLVSGTTYVGSGQDAWLWRIDEGGRTVWHKSFRGPHLDTLVDVFPTPDGGLFASGWSQSFDPVGTGGGQSNLWAVRGAVDGMQHITGSYSTNTWNEEYQVDTFDHDYTLLNESATDVAFTVSDSFPTVTPIVVSTIDLTP